MQVIWHHHERIQFYLGETLRQAKPFALRYQTGFAQLHRMVDHLTKDWPALPGQDGDEIGRREGVVVTG